MVHKKGARHYEKYKDYDGVEWDIPYNKVIDKLSQFGTYFSTCNKGVIAQSGVLASESSGDQIDFCYLNTVFELYSSYHFGQVVEAA